MSVTGADPTGEEWADYEHQRDRIVIEYPAAELSNGIVDGEENFATLEPANGLGRGEMAELVYAEFQVGHEMGATATAEGAIEWKLTVALTPDTAFHGDPSITGSAGGSGQADTYRFTDDQPDILMRSRTVVEPSFADTTNGLGGGADYDGNEVYEYDYRNGMVGKGPLVDARDEINYSYSVDADNVDDHLIGAYVEAHLVWDVFDAPEIQSIR